ncbi:MAG: hypothetical protein RJB39_735 [Candidatus Parcubacteria bacterium]|jgi:uncharacterized protein YndB with AHSA1/START domain
MKINITVETTIQAPIEKVWKYWNEPEHITKWAFASADWHAPHAENDLRVGGNFSTRMEAKDGSMGFDMAGTYTEVEEFKKISYTFGDRKATIQFIPEGDVVKVVEIFDAEDENPIEMQRDGWQAILENFKKHVETA